MAKQGAFTAVVEIDERKIADLRTLLKGIGDGVNEPECPIAFGKLGTVHFMRWLILEAGHDAACRSYPPYLVLSTNHDEPLAAHLDELVRVAGAEFDKIYTCC